MEIREIDVHDEAQLTAWFDAEGAAILHGRPHAVRRTFDALVNQVTEPSDYYEPVLTTRSSPGRAVAPTT